MLLSKLLTRSGTVSWHGISPEGFTGIELEGGQGITGRG